jgi:hypothetical protein
MSCARRFSTALLAGVATILALPSVAAASTPTAKPPTQAQIRSAVAKLERSHDLWATVDICNTKHHPRVIGIRGQMPSLGFATSHELNIRIDYQPTTKLGYRPSGVKKSIALGWTSNQLLQGGASWQFPSHTGKLRGTVTFVWRRGNQLIDRITRTTSAGHRDVDFGDPARFTAADCTIP